MLKAPRASSEHDRLALKAAVARALKLAGGSASFQHSTRLHESNLSRAASPHAEDQHLPLDVALDLDREAQAPVILSELARILGYALKPLKDDAAGSLALPEAIEMMSAAHKASATVLAALEDGNVSTAEAQGAARDIDKAIRSLTHVRGKLSGAKR